ncbi:MAG: SDR family NAD(P)-dependent oxidoreductase [Actinobacteria bacterium]|nr:SDR family NAD(P)-dependent oxidoreductase [Actinomycetota bacterium]
MSGRKLPRRKGMEWFRGKVALVTGAASGLGRGIALSCVRAGCDLVAVDIDTEGLRGLAAEVEGMGGSCLAREADVSRRDQVEELAREVILLKGGVDLLVNNAGVAVGGELDLIPPEDLDWIVGVNLMGEIYGCRFFLPHMIERGGGHIVNIASVSGFAALPLHIAYTATKFGIVGFSEVLWTEARNHGVGVTVVCPGAVSTSIGERGRTYYRTEKQRVSEEKYAEALQRKGMDPEVAGRKILEAVAANRFLCLLGREAHALYYLKRLCPMLMLRTVSAVTRYVTR